MSHDDSLESILSDDELRALLQGESEPEAVARAGRSSREDAAAPRATSAPGRQTPGEGLSIILASRHTADAALLAERLKAAGFRVDAVRSAFRALDLLRAGPYVAVLTDLALWADGARLLFQRLESCREPPLIVLLTDRRASPASRPGKAGVAGELLCPLSPLEVEVAVEQLVAAATDRHETVPTAERRGLIGEEEIGPASLRSGAPIGSGDARDALLAGRSALDLGPYRWEIPWLRFFLEAQRRLRTHSSRDALLSALIALGGDVLGAEAAGAATLTGADLTAHVKVASGRSGAVGRRLLSEISDLLERPEDDGGRRRDGPDVFSMDVPLPTGDAASPRSREEGVCRVVFIGLSRPIWSAGLTFRDDLRAVVMEALKR